MPVLYGLEVDLSGASFAERRRRRFWPLMWAVACELQATVPSHADGAWRATTTNLVGPGGADVVLGGVGRRSQTWSRPMRSSDCRRG